MKRAFTFLVSTGFWFISQAGFSQERVTYTYDAAGNRTSRTVDSNLRSAEQEEQTPVFPETPGDLRISVYPNPTEGRIRIDIQNLPKGETADLRLYSLSGALLMSRQDVVSSTEMDITGQAAGTYLLKLVAGKQQAEWKIIKK
jgi:hypothetical protein